ncbi:MAG: carbohydrate ABC transporter permease [Meiothermus sp.]|nr:carbohydrate ABC transporter permease [Meiothermus sp.]
MDQPQRKTSSASPSSLGRSALTYLVLGVAAVFAGIPFFWMVTSALKPPDEILVYPPRWIPSEIRWQNFVEAWNAAPFGVYYLNSLAISSLQTALEILIGVAGAYAFARIKVPGRELIFALVLGTLMIPNDVTLIPNYITLANLGWINTYMGIILPSVASAFSIFLLRQHMLSLPEELFEAAKLDGAHHGQMLRHIAVPLSMPVIVTLALLNFVSSWNAYLWPLIVTNSDAMRTLPIGLKLMRDAEQGDPWHLLMAASTFVVIPIILLFLFCQRFFVQGITAGAVKGG